MSKPEAAIRIREVFDGVRAYVSDVGGHRLSEADTRAEFIDPILAALGYRNISNMRREVRIADTSESLDYVLQPDGHRRVAVEAKSIDRQIQEKDAAQVVQYCSILGIRWAVVTNARERRLYDQFNRGQLSEKLVYNLELGRLKSDQDQQTDFERLWLLSTDAFTNGDGPADWIESRRVDAILRTALVDEVSPEIRYLRRRLEEQGMKLKARDVAAWFAEALADHSQPPWPLVHDPKKKPPPPPKPPGDAEHYLVPASSSPGVPAIQSLHNWLDREMWGMHEKTGARKSLKAGDLFAFYAGKTGMVACAEVTGRADTLIAGEEWPEPRPMDQPVYKVPLRNVVWFPAPRPLDLALRSSLDAFEKHAADGNWAFFVMNTHRISRDDFRRLIGDPT